MKKIGGNVDCVLKYQTIAEDATGEQATNWLELQTIRGFLDLMNSGKDFATYNKAMLDSTHVFVCDYVNITKSATELRASINGLDYDVTFIDNPMGLNYHLEIFLKRVGE